MPTSEARFDSRQAQATWRLFDETRPPCAIPSLIYLLEGSNGRLLLDHDEALYPGGLYVGPQALAPRIEAGSTVRGIQIATPTTGAQRLCKTQIPVVIAPGTRTRLLAGSINTCASPLPWPGALIDLRLDTGIGWTAPCDHATRIIVLSGELQADGTPMPAGDEYALAGAATLYASRRSHALVWLSPHAG
ncbi:hypothetical protein [Jeongeupia naejangsanensis]|uniref:HutD family protein n=1 Tax=Jeongeupia naejangsanensis TaxID=613195 RepID=A0ABS2BJ92_9NEIS|nr:hypothetical protein [Jeongeupia naejangsanensis]MBM3115683.1 hypothetical protein [Jeongeupia naejangsanensis]